MPKTTKTITQMKVEFNELAIKYNKMGADLMEAENIIMEYKKTDINKAYKLLADENEKLRRIINKK
tara:strand:+ start:20 stop:217 length:198 start_codon:yes stop_codon:yes gene_type:complete